MKTIHIFLLFILIIVPTSAQSPGVSLLYNEEHEFRFDPEKTISKNQYMVWSRAEKNILEHSGSDIYQNLSEEIAKDKLVTRNYVSFSVSKNKIISVKFENGPRSKQLMEHVEKNKDVIIKELLRVKKQNFKDTISIDGTYYIAL